MHERTYLINGRFLNGLDSWTAASATFLASDGDEQYGMAQLSVGGSIAQPFNVAKARSYTLHIAVKPATTLASGDATVALTTNGNPVTTLNLTGVAGLWTENTFTVGLVPAVNYKLTVNAVNVAVKIDDVWLWFVPTTRAALAQRVLTRLGGLATDQSLSLAPSGTQTEGDFTGAVDTGLRTIGAIDPETDAIDIRYLSIEMVDTAITALEREMLQQLYRTFSLQTDISVGPRHESLSQVAKAIERLLASTASTSRQVQQARIKRDDLWPYQIYRDGTTLPDMFIRSKEDGDR